MDWKRNWYKYPWCPEDESLNISTSTGWIGTTFLVMVLRRRIIITLLIPLYLPSFSLRSGLYKEVRKKHKKSDNHSGFRQSLSNWALGERKRSNKGYTDISDAFAVSFTNSVKPLPCLQPLEECWVCINKDHGFDLLYMKSIMR